MNNLPHASPMEYANEIGNTAVKPSETRSAEPAFPDDWNYEATVSKVETIIAQIESGELELADVFDQFAAAVAYLQQCDVFLNQHQQKMDLLIETLADKSKAAP